LRAEKGQKWKKPLKNSKNGFLWTDLRFSLTFQNFMPHIEFMKFCQNHWSLNCVVSAGHRTWCKIINKILWRTVNDLNTRQLEYDWFIRLKYWRIFASKGWQISSHSLSSLFPPFFLPSRLLTSSFSLLPIPSPVPVSSYSRLLSPCWNGIHWTLGGKTVARNGSLDNSFDYFFIRY
jgi:hypothetical protein